MWPPGTASLRAIFKNCFCAIPVLPQSFTIRSTASNAGCGSYHKKTFHSRLSPMIAAISISRILSASSNPLRVIPHQAMRRPVRPSPLLSLRDSCSILYNSRFVRGDNFDVDNNVIKLKQKTMSTSVEKFAGLHQSSDLFVMPNVWNARSALAFQECGFPAVATSSAAVADSLGYPDGEGTPFAEYVSVIRR